MDFSNIGIKELAKGACFQFKSPNESSKTINATLTKMLQGNSS